MENDKKKDGRGGARANTGGARAGAGRKKIGEDALKKRIFFRVSNSEYDLIEATSKEFGITVGQFARKVSLEYVMNKNVDD